LRLPVSRLIDRIRAEGCEPFRPSHLATEEAWIESLEDASEAHDIEGVSAEQLRRLYRTPSVRRRFEPESTERLDPAALQGIPVIAADEVARYCGQFAGSDMATIVTTARAAPFDRMWIDVQGAPNPLHARAWGVLVENITEAVGGAGPATTSAGTCC